ncbi:MAG: hypothetical protein HQ466_04425 [Cryomorphaceae bacterium]|nr:hypothetical protein [Cryomorphaceae bacterium]
MRLATLALLAVLAWWVMPHWLQDGMFMDGQIYAAVAQNLADGLGTFWAPVYQPSAPYPYSEQLPMFTGMESLLFRVLGGTVWTERVFMAFAWIATAAGIGALQRRLWPERGSDSALWIVALWSSAPLVGWGMGNHVQEMWMAPFTVWAVVAMSHSRWVWMGGLLTVAAALFKGPQGLFPLVWLPLFGGLGLVPRTEVVRRLGIVLATVLITAFGLWLWDDAREAILRNAGNRLVRTFTHDRAVTTADRMWLLGPMLGQWLVILGTALAVAWVRFGLVRATMDRRALAMLALGLCASLPLMVTKEQRDFYLITSLGFVALGLGNALGGTKVVRRPRFAVAVGLIAIVSLSSMPWRRVERDSELRASLAMFKEEFAPRSAFNVVPELQLNHELAAYAMRHYRWEVDLNNAFHHTNRIQADSANQGGVILSSQKE